MVALTALLLFPMAFADPTPADVETWKRLQSTLDAAYPTSTSPTVRVEDRVVWVSGRIESEAERARVHGVIHELDPTLTIDDGLEVGGPTVVDDLVAEGAIQRQLESMELDDVDVVVEGGMARARGEVASSEQAHLVHLALLSPDDVGGAVTSVSIDDPVDTVPLKTAVRATLFWSGAEYTDLRVDETLHAVQATTFTRRNARRIRRAFAKQLPEVDLDVTLR